MILTKAYITEIPEKGSNIFKVNVPLMQDNVSDEAIFDALLATTPGSYNDYKVGDCVFVDFEDDKYNIAIILGKLFTEVPEENNAYGLYNQLNVTGSAVLPENTYIGKYTPQDIFNLYQGVESGVGGGSINPDDLKPYVRWKLSKNAEEAGEDPNRENVRLYADKLRLDHTHWVAPNIKLDDEGEYVTKPESLDIDIYSDDVKMQLVQYEEHNEGEYGNRMIVLSGQDYDSISEINEHAFYFLTSPRPSER